MLSRQWKCSADEHDSCRSLPVLHTVAMQVAMTAPAQESLRRTLFVHEASCRSIFESWEYLFRHTAGAQVVGGRHEFPGGQHQGASGPEGAAK